MNTAEIAHVCAKVCILETEEKRNIYPWNTNIHIPLEKKRDDPEFSSSATMRFTILVLSEMLQQLLIPTELMTVQYLWCVKVGYAIPEKSSTMTNGLQWYRVKNDTASTVTNIS